MKPASTFSYAALFALLSFTAVRSDVPDEPFVPVIDHCSGTSISYDGKPVAVTCKAAF